MSELNITQLTIDECDLCKWPSTKVAEIEYQNGYDPFPVMRFINICAKCALEITYRIHQDKE